MPNPSGTFGLGPIVRQNYSRYGGKYRLGSLLPVSSTPLPTFVGVPPNLEHETDVYQSLIPELAGGNANAAVWSTTGQRLTADLVNPSAHTHNLDRTLLDWRLVGAWQPVGDRNTNLEAWSPKSTDTENRFAWVAFLAPFGARYLFPRLKLTAPVGAGVCDIFEVSLDLYDATIGTPQSVALVADMRNGRTYTEEWIESRPIDLLKVLTFPGSDQRCFGLWRFAFINVTSGTPEAAVWEIQLGLYAG